MTDHPHGPAAARGAILGEMRAAELAFVDVRVRALLGRELRRRVLTRVFGVPAAEQSALVTLLLLGAGAGLLRRPMPPAPSRASALMGTAVVTTAARGVLGPAAARIPFAGGLIAFAVVSHSLRPTVAGVARQARLAMDEVPRALLGIRRR